MSIAEVRIPDIGDAQDVEVVEIPVSVGSTVGPDDTLVVLESDKASMDVPATVAGVVESIEVVMGAKVVEGTLVARIRTTGEGAAPPPAQPAAATAPAPVAAAPTPAPSPASAPAPVPAPAAPAAARRVDVPVPDIGDAKDVTVVELCVAEGDEVAAGATLVVLESDKASMEVAAPVAGRVVTLCVAVDAMVETGTRVAVIETVDGGAAPAAVSAEPAAVPAPPAAAAAGSAPSPVAVAAPAPAPAAVRPADGESRSAAPAGGKVYAGPAVRRLARELGVDLARVAGTGARGRIVKENVQQFVRAALSAPPAAAAPAAATGSGIPPIPAVDFARFGAIEKVKISRIMRAGATNLHRSWLNLPHVTHNDDADITELEVFRKSLKGEAEARGVRLTPLAFLVKAVVATLKLHPQFNMSIDADGEHFVMKKYWHIGMAVDTPAGLLVPVIRDADQKGLYDLATEIADLSARAREGKLKAGEMQGGTFSITSLGALGGTSFTPIINAPEVAILGVAKLAVRPVWNGREFVPREMLPLSLSYDHRALNGADAARFVTSLCGMLADLKRALL